MVALFRFLFLSCALCVAEAAYKYGMALNAFLEGYCPRDSRSAFDTLKEAQSSCNLVSECGGITREPVRPLLPCIHSGSRLRCEFYPSLRLLVVANAIVTMHLETTISVGKSLPLGGTVLTVVEGSRWGWW